MPFLIIGKISECTSNSCSNFIYFKHSCHTNPDAERKRAGSSSQISRYFVHTDYNIFLGFKSKVLPDSFNMFIVRIFDTFHC